MRSLQKVLIFLSMMVVLGIATGCAAPSSPVPAATQPPPTVAVATLPIPTQAPATKPAPTQPPPTQPAATQTAPPAAQVVKGGTLIVTQGQNVADTLNQHTSTWTYSRMAAHNVLDTLVAVNPKDGSINPWLATSWEVSADGTIYTFKLRQGVKFHDGTPFNAQAVKYNFDYTVRPDIKHGFAYNALGGGTYDKSEVVDDYTVKVYFKVPRPTLLINLSDGGMGIDSPTAMDKFGSDYGIKALVGTGPYKLKEFVQNDHLTLVRNDDYNWAPSFFKHQGPPYLDQLIYRDVKDAATGAAALEAGEIGVVALSESQVAQFKGNKDVQIVTIPKAGSARMYMMNNTKPPTDDIKVRQAIEYAIDKNGLLQLPAWSGIGLPGLAVLPNNMLPADALTTLKQYDYAYNPEKSKQLLEEAGWKLGADGIRVKDGQKLVLDFVNYPDVVPQAEPLVDMLRKVGMQVNIRVGDVNFLLSERAKGNFNLVIGSDSSADPFRLVDYHFYSKSTYIGYKNADEYIDKARSATSEKVMWENLTLAQIQVLKDAAAVMGWQQMYVFGVRSNVKDVFFNEVGYPYYYDAWVSK